MNPLLEPFSFRCGARAPNRVALAPLTNGQSRPDGTLGDEEYEWLVRRGRGGFGLVSTCAAHVTAAGQGFDGQLGVWSDAQLEGLGRLASGVAHHGGLPIAQLYHGGARSPSRLTGVQPVSASAFVEPGNAEFEVPRAASDAEVEGFVSAFREAAARVARAGFAGVELHGAHGYLLGQFLSSTQNTRDDRWGGSLEGRAALLRAVIRAVRSAVEPSFVVGVRLSPEDFGQARGLDLDESVRVAQWAADDGVDFVHLSLWDHRRSTRKRPERHALDLFRPALPPEVALVVAGDVWTQDEARGLLDRGADLVAIGRAAILDPDWPTRVARDGHEPVRPPRTPDQLAEVGVSPAFVRYLARFRNLVAST